MFSQASVSLREQRWNEDVLATAVTAPVWRMWTYEEPAVVLGCSQRRLLASAPDHGPGIDFLVRESGGGAVLVGPWMLGLSVALPVKHPLAAGGVESYRWLGQTVAGVLQAAGIEAHAAAPRAAAGASTVPWACFGALSPWEVAVGERKIAGLAQVRRRNGVLLVGGVLLDSPDWALLCTALGRPPAEAATLRELTTSVACQGRPVDALAARLASALEEVLAGRAGCDPTSPLTT